MSHVIYGTAGAAGCLVTGLVHWAWQSCLLEPHLLTRRLCLLSRMTCSVPDSAGVADGVPNSAPITADGCSLSALSASAFTR